MNKTKPSFIATVRAQYSSNRKQVLWLTGMTEFELNTFIFDTGMDWIRHYTGEDTEMALALMQDPIIWSWWLNEWNRRDDKIVLKLIYKNPKESPLAQYRTYHQVVFMENEPPYELLEDSYKEVIGKFNDKIVKL